MYDSRRSRARRGVDPSAPQPPKAPPAPHAPNHSLHFNIPLNGYGEVVLTEYTPDCNEFARIDFTCKVPGVLHIKIDRKPVLTAKVAAGRALVTGLFLPKAANVLISFTNEWAGGAVAGHIHIGPAPVADTLAAARKLFGLSPGFSAEELSRAHKRLVMQWHPDRPGGDTAKMAEINHHRDILQASLG
jgi:hypothetical protein